MSDIFSLYLKALAMAVWGFAAPVMPVIASLFILVFIDTFLGIWAAIKLKESLISGKGWRLITKLCIMSVTLVAMHNFELLSRNLIPAVSLVATALAIVEAKSILENAGIILGQPLFKYLITKLDSKNIEKPKGEKKK